MNKNVFKTLFYRYKNLPKEIRNIIICVICLIIVINGSIFIRYMRKTHTYNMKLNDSNYITMYEGGEYEELGAVALTPKNKDVSKKIKITNNIDVDKVGTYEVIYHADSIWKKNEIRRKVEVLPNPIDTMEFKLLGKEEMRVKLNSEYKDPGYDIKSSYDDDFNKYVTVDGEVNTKKIGEYILKYTIKINKKEKSITRKVYVVGARYSVIYDKEYTNEDIEVKVVSNTSDFLYFNLGNERLTDDIITVKAKDNGTYSLNMVNKSKIDNIKFEITNIDREEPTGTCTAYKYKTSNKTTYEVDAEDNIGIAKYMVNNKESIKPNFTYNKYFENGEVTIYDEAGNSSKISCTTYYGPDIPSKDANIIKSFDGNTLKYWVEKNNTYNITHIWVKDAYNQFKTGIKEPYPLITTSLSIMNYVSKTNNYENKAMIGSNASGIVSDYFNVETATLMPEWKDSSKSSVVMVDGSVIRNFTNLKIPKMNAITYGLKKDGYLDYYKLNNYNDITTNVLNFDRLVSDGVKYTFAFAPVLIHNGNISSGLSYDNNIRQALGQIDLNNFIIVTTNTTNRGLGLSYYNLAKLMSNLNCIEAYNLDGGGSTSLIYKDKDTNTSKSIIYSSRYIPDIIYFVGE